MKEIIPNWLDNPSLSHVLACSVRLPNGENHVQVSGTEPANENFQQAISQVASVIPALRKQRLLPGQMVWNFANGRLYYAVRDDGATLGLYCRAGSDTETAAVSDFLTDFMQQT
ncbi:MAG TPA: hypothetical protein VFZ59_14375 [Verrucomicrobiae bacterium]|nr:hypothetical protein [Verrucomicrobiae bacterium]